MADYEIVRFATLNPEPFSTHFRPNATRRIIESENLKLCTFMYLFTNENRNGKDFCLTQLEETPIKFTEKNC